MRTFSVNAVQGRVGMFLASFAMTAMAMAQDHAHAVEHASPSVVQDVKAGAAPAIVTLVVFALVFAILATLVWPKILGGLNERANKIADEIEAAEMARKQAKDALDEYQKSLSEARAEAQRMIEQARSQQLAVAATEKAKLESELSKERERAMKDIEAAKRAAVAELYKETAVLATTLASKILKRNINAADQAQLIEESLGQMQSMRN